MELRGYVAFNVHPWEAASGGKESNALGV